MHAWVLEDFGIESLKRIEVETPQPGPGEVLLRIRAVSLNYVDLMVVEGRYDRHPALPFIPLSDAAGEVVSVGAGVRRVKAGDRVATVYKAHWIAGRRRPPGNDTADALPPGVLAEYAVLDAEACLPFPEHLSFEEASTLPIAGVTAWSALFADAPLLPGQCVLVQGTGGVAVFALQFARAAGARVIVSSSSDEKLTRARELGAHELINSRSTPAWDERVRTLTDGDGADLVLDVAGTTLARSVQATRVGGQVSVIGFLGGTSTHVDIIPWLQRNVRLQGIGVGSRQDFEDMNRAIRAQRLRPVIHRTYPFERAPDALATLRSGTGYVGKLVIAGF